MAEILKAFFQLIIWTFVPAMSAVVLLKLYTLSQGNAAKEYQSSMRAGFWGGLVLFLIIFVAQVGRFVQTSFPHEPIYQGFNPFLAIGTAVAMLLILYGKQTVRAHLIGWLVLGITTVALWALFHYLFIHTANEYILSLYFGTALGIFAHTALLPFKRAVA